MCEYLQHDDRWDGEYLQHDDRWDGGALVHGGVQVPGERIVEEDGRFSGWWGRCLSDGSGWWGGGV